MLPWRKSNELSVWREHGLILADRFFVMFIKAPHEEDCDEASLLHQRHLPVTAHRRSPCPQSAFCPCENDFNRSSHWRKHMYLAIRGFESHITIPSEVLRKHSHAHSLDSSSDIVEDKVSNPVVPFILRPRHNRPVRQRNPPVTSPDFPCISRTFRAATQSINQPLPTPNPSVETTREWWMSATSEQSSRPGNVHR